MQINPDTLVSIIALSLANLVALGGVFLRVENRLTKIETLNTERENVAATWRTSVTNKIESLERRMGEFEKDLARHMPTRPAPR